MCLIHNHSIYRMYHCRVDSLENTETSELEPSPVLDGLSGVQVRGGHKGLAGYLYGRGKSTYVGMVSKGTLLPNPRDGTIETPNGNVVSLRKTCCHLRT